MFIKTFYATPPPIPCHPFFLLPSLASHDHAAQRTIFLVVIMWDLIPVEIQGRLFEWCSVRQWYLYLKTHRRAWDTFPSLYITYMDLWDLWINTKKRATLTVLREIAVDFHLPGLKVISSPVFYLHQSNDYGYDIKAFLKSFPHARIVVHSSVSLRMFMMYASGMTGPVASEWFDRMDAYSVGSASDTVPDKPLVQVRAKRLLQKGFALHLDMNPQTPLRERPFWIQLFELAGKIDICAKRDEWKRIVRFLNYPVSLFDTHKIKGHQNETGLIMTGPVLDRLHSFESLDPRHVQSVYVLLNDGDGIRAFLNHKDHFCTSSIEPYVSARAMASVPHDMWMDALVNRWVSLGHVYEIIHVFLFYLDDAWCSLPDQLKCIASYLVDIAMRLYDVEVPEPELIGRFSSRRAPGVKLDFMMERILYWVNAFPEDSYTGIRARQLLSHFTHYTYLGKLFLNELNGSEFLDWALPVI